jgi:hypothetical protein
MINEDFLAFLHDELSENQARLREILGESRASAVFGWCAERLVGTVGTGRYGHDPIEGIVKRLNGWGMTVSQRARRGAIELEIKCPYAEHVHSRLFSRVPRCPLGEYIIGAVRLEDSKSRLVHNALTEEGARLTISQSGEELDAGL